MFNRRAMIVAALALAGAPAFASAQEEAGQPPRTESGDEALILLALIDSHVHARGGAAALDAVHAMVMHTEIKAHGHTLLGGYGATVEGLMRADIFADGDRAFSGGLDRDGAWEWPGDAPAPHPASATAAANSRHGLMFNLFGLHRLMEKGCTLTLAGREVVEGINYYVIDVRFPDATHAFRYINPTTWMVERGRDQRAVPADAPPDAPFTETVFSEFRPVAGVMTPFGVSQADLRTGAILQTAQVQDLRYNPPASALHLARTDVVEPPPET